jgi:hypothetical protein
MNDNEKWQAMKKLGVKWPKSSILPTYTASMTEEQKREADQLYDSMSAEFVYSFGTSAI